MKITTLVALANAGQISKPLLNAWKETTHTTNRSIVGDAESEIVNQKIAVGVGIVVPIVANAALAFFLAYGSRHAVGVSMTLAVFSAFVCTCAASRLLVRDRYSTFGTHLEELGRVLGLNCGQMAAMTHDELRQKADKVMRVMLHELKERQMGAATFHPHTDILRKDIHHDHILLKRFKLVKDDIDEYFEAPKCGIEVVSL